MNANKLYLVFNRIKQMNYFHIRWSHGWWNRQLVA
jgi:hypothetical protein